ncbi:MFS transporter, partial [Escherichia coli]
MAGPGLAGALIKLFGAPLALAVDAALLLVSAVILRGIQVKEALVERPDQHFWQELKAGLQFVRERRLLVSLATATGSWQLFHNAALVVQILFATRELHLSAQTVGLSYIA